MPKAQKDALKVDTIEYVVQINGKLRGRVQVPASSDNATIEKAAREDETIAKHLINMQLKKAIVIPARQLVNLVIAEK